MYINKPTKQARAVVVRDESQGLPWTRFGVMVDGEIYMLDGSSTVMKFNDAKVDDFSDVHVTFCRYDMLTVKPLPTWPNDDRDQLAFEFTEAE